MAKYRILERQSERGWVAFAVAYQRRERPVLFAPAWRGQRPLAAASLEELDETHFPAGSGRYRWSDIRSRPGDFEHPIEMLKEELQPTVEGAAESPREPAAPEANAPAGETGSARVAWGDLIPQLLGLSLAEIFSAAGRAVVDQGGALALVPALIEAPGRGRASTLVSILAPPHLTTTGALVLVVQVPPGYFDAGDPLEVMLYLAPGEVLLPTSDPLVVGRPAALRFSLPPDALAAWQAAEWRQRLRLYLHPPRSAPHRPETRSPDSHGSP